MLVTRWPPRAARRSLRAWPRSARPTRARRHARGPQPAAAAGGPQPVRGQRAARRGARRARAPAGRAERAARGRRVLGRRAVAVWGERGERAPAGAAHARPLRQPDRRGRVRPGLAPADDRGVRDELHALPWRTDEPARHTRARRACTSPRCRPRPGFACPTTMTFAVDPGAARCSPSSPPSGSRC